MLGFSPFNTIYDHNIAWNILFTHQNNRKYSFSSLTATASSDISILWCVPFRQRTKLVGDPFWVLTRSLGNAPWTLYCILQLFNKIRVLQNNILLKYMYISFLGLQGLRTSQLFFPSIFRKPRPFRLTNHSESRDHPITLLLVYAREWPTLTCLCHLSSLVSGFSIRTWRVSYVSCCWWSSADLRSRRRRPEAATCRQQVRGESGNYVGVCFSRFVLPLKRNKTSGEGLNL